jgi:hypothetical protein
MHATTLPMPEQTNFNCPICEALYKVVRVEAPAESDKSLTCLGCGAPLRNREGKLALKYFRVDGSRRSTGGRQPRF